MSAPWIVLIMYDSPSITSLMPDLFKTPRHTAGGLNPLIISAEILQLKEVYALQVVHGLQPKIDPSTKIKMYATFSANSVLDAILKAYPQNFLKVLWTPCQDFAFWIGSAKCTDNLNDLLKVLDLTGFGNAYVEDLGNIPALVTLHDILLLYRNNTMKSPLLVSEIGSEIVEISPQTYLIDAIALMFQKKMKRLFLTTKKESVFPFLSRRDIIRFLFSPSRLELAKKDPERWVNSQLEEISPSEAKIVHDGIAVNQAAKEFGDAIDDCLVCENSEKVVTRMDLVMKPWKTNNYSFE